MYWSDTSYVCVLLLLAAAGTSIALAYYARQRHTAPGATAFAILMLAVAVWSVGYAMEMSVSDLAAKIFWAKFQYLGIVAVPLAWVAFALPYTRRGQGLTSRKLMLIATVPLVTLLLVWTNQTHGLIWQQIELERTGPFVALKLTYGPAFWLHLAFSYLLLLIGTFWLVAMTLRSTHVYRLQAGAMLLAGLIPWLGNGLYLTGLSPIPNLDLTPFAFAVSGLIFVWALFRFRLLDLVPIARRTVVDGLNDAVIILDQQNRVVDLNPAAQNILGVSAAKAIGRTGTQVMAGHAGLIDRYRHMAAGQTELALGQGDRLRHFELHLSPLTDRHNRHLGRVMVLHDITTRKQAEEKLRDQKQLFESLVTVARATAEQPTLEATLQNALDVAAVLTTAERGSILLLDEHNVVTHSIAALGKERPGQDPRYISRVMDEGLAGWVVRHRQPALVSDTASDERWLPFPDEAKATVRSALAVPIVSQSSALGILTLTHSDLAHFTVDHLELMQAAADQMSLALRNAQIFEAQRRLADHQITLYEILRTVAGQTEPDQVVRVAVETINQFAGWPNVVIALPDKEKTHWTAHTVTGSFAALAGQTIPLAADLISLAFKTVKTQLAADVTGEPNSYINGLSNAGSLLAVPLRRGRGRVLGVLGLASQQLAAFKTDDVFLAESLAEAIGLTLDNAHLHAETRQRLRAQTALREASAVISSTLDLPIVLSHIAEQLGRAADVTSTYICNYEPETMSATVLANYFEPQACTQEQMVDLETTYHLPRDFPDLITALRAGQPRLYQLENPYLPDQQRAYMAQVGVQTTLIIPLQIRDETTAYAELRESRQQREFTSDEIEFCQSIAQQAAIALENARVYQEARQHAAGLSALYTITRMVNQSLLLADVLPQALSSVLILLGFEAGMISLVNRANGQLESAATYGFPSILPTYFQHDELNCTLCQYVHTHQEVLTLSDLSQEAPIDVSDFITLGFRGYVGIPLQHGEQPLGVLSLFSRQRRTTSFDDLALLTTIGNQVAVAVAHARLFQTIRDQHIRLQALIESNRDGIVLIGMDRRVLVTNAPTLEFLKLSGKPEDWTGRSVLDALAALRRRSPALVQATLAEIHRIQQGDEPPGEGEVEVSSRTLHWLNLPVLAGSMPLGRLVVLRDVTEERLLENMRNDLTHTMVHDLRNPLTAIVGSLHMIELLADNLVPDQRHMLEVALNRSIGMRELVNDILDVSSLESGQIPLNRDQVSLANLIDEILQAQLPLAAEKNLRLDRDISSSLPPVCLDRRLIERVLQNLVGNAIKFTPSGGSVKVTAKAVQTAANSGSGPSFQLHFTVSDSGPGISPELKSRLFQKFVTGRHEESGSGLGLAFCKLAVEAHGGQIWVDSEPGQGAVFNITLPAANKLNGHNGKQR